MEKLKIRKKAVKFNEKLNKRYTYEPTEDVQELTWTQIALDELRFRRPIVLMLEEKMKHLTYCEKTCPETCARFTSMGK